MNTKHYPMKTNVRLQLNKDGKIERFVEHSFSAISHVGGDTTEADLDATHQENEDEDNEELKLHNANMLGAYKYNQLPETLKTIQSMFEGHGVDVAPTAKPKALLPGKIRGKLVLESLPTLRNPAVFRFDKEPYTVPSGKAWDIVQGMIEANAFEGHAIELEKRATDHFKREHRRFYSLIMLTAQGGKRYLKTK